MVQELSTLGGSKISIEPVETQNSSGKPRKLQAIDQAGNLIYKDNADQKLTDRLHRVWQERGDFNLMSTAELAQDPAFAIERLEPGDDKEDQTEEVNEEGKMTFEAMARMRAELLQNLNVARNEIWLVFELARTLVASANQAAAEKPVPEPETKKGKGKKVATAVPIEPIPEPTPAPTEPTDPNPLLLPIGSITTSTSINPYQPLSKQVRAMQLAQATQRQAALKCADMFEDALKQMKVTNTRSEVYWENVLKLRDGNRRWSLMAKPAFGVHARGSGNARDVAIPYALDEAGPSIRAQCLATLSQAHHANSTVEYHARRHRRLRCKLIQNNGTVQHVSTPIKSDESSLSPSESLSEAQREVLDEEIYAECVAEVRRSNFGACVVLKNSVSVPVANDSTVVFSMYDTREESVPTSLATSPLCDALLASTQLLMLNIYRHRKTRIYKRSNNAALPPSKAPLLVRPIINMLRFKTLATRLTDILTNFINTLRAAGLNVSDNTISTFSGIESFSAILESFGSSSEGASDISLAHMLAIEDCPVISVSISLQDEIRVTLPHATFPLEDLALLHEVLAVQAGQLLISWLMRKLSNGGEEVRMFVDELDDRLVLGSYSMYVSFPPDKLTRAVNSMSLSALGRHLKQSQQAQASLNRSGEPASTFKM